MKILDLNLGYDVVDGRAHADVAAASLEAMKNKLQHIFTTPIGSVPRHRKYGSQVPFVLQEPISDRAIASLKSAMLQAAQEFEPRADYSLGGISVTARSSSAFTGYKVLFQFIPKDTGVKASMSFNLTA